MNTLKTIATSARTRLIGIGAVAASVAMLAFPAFSASAAPQHPQWVKTTATVTVTQEQINDNPRIKHHDPRFSDPDITLLDGQAQVSSVFTGIDPNTSASDVAVQVISIWSPVVRAGRIDWAFVSATVGGHPTSADFVRDHRFGLRDSVNDEVRKTINAQFDSHIYRDTAVTVSPDGVAVTATIWERQSATAAPTPAAATAS